MQGEVVTFADMLAQFHIMIAIRLIVEQKASLTSLLTASWKAAFSLVWTKVKIPLPSAGGLADRPEFL